MVIRNKTIPKNMSSTQTTVVTTTTRTVPSNDERYVDPHRPTDVIKLADGSEHIKYKNSSKIRQYFPTMTVEERRMNPGMSVMELHNEKMGERGWVYFIPSFTRRGRELVERYSEWNNDGGRYVPGVHGEMIVGEEAMHHRVAEIRQLEYMSKNWVTIQALA